MDDTKDLVWLKSDEARLVDELRDAERDDPDSIAAYLIRRELNDVRDDIDYAEGVEGTEI